MTKEQIEAFKDIREHKKDSLPLGIFYSKNEERLNYLARIELPMTDVNIGRYPTLKAAKKALKEYEQEIKVFFLTTRKTKYGQRLKRTDGVNINCYDRGNKVLSRIRYLGKSYYFGTYTNRFLAEEAAEEAAEMMRAHQNEWDEPMEDMEDLVRFIKDKHNQPEDNWE